MNPQKRTSPRDTRDARDTRQTDRASAPAPIPITLTEKDAVHFQTPTLQMVTAGRITFTLARVQAGKRIRPEHTLIPREKLINGRCRKWRIVRQDFGDDGAQVGETRCWDFTLTAPVDNTTAHACFLRMPNRPDAKPRLTVSTPTTPQSQDIETGKWKVWAKRFPQTVRLWKHAALATSGTERRELEEQALFAFRVEGAKLRGDLSTYYGHLAKDLRYTPQEIHPVDRELLLNYEREKYSKLKPEELARKVSAALGKRHSAAAVKKRRLRLGLVSERNEGRPETSY